jgi:hypothetical protein
MPPPLILRLSLPPLIIDIAAIHYDSAAISFSCKYYAFPSLPCHMMPQLRRCLIFDYPLIFIFITPPYAFIIEAFHAAFRHILQHFRFSPHYTYWLY